MRKLFTEFPLHIPGLYGFTPYLQKYETVVQASVKLGIILTCKTECKGLFRSRKACKHHRTTLRKLADVKPRFFHLIYHAFISIAHSCEINLRQLVATFNRLPVSKYVKRSWAPHDFVFILPLHVLAFHFFFVTDNVHKWQREEIIYLLESNPLILSVTNLLWVKTKNTNSNDNTHSIIPHKKEEFRHLIKCERR